MVPVGHGVFVQFPDEFDRRVLHPATVVGSSDELFTAQLEKEAPPFEPDESIILYYQKKEFMQQAARVVSVTEREPETEDVCAAGDECGPVFQFELTGEPASAESRQHYRVSTVMSDLTARLGCEDSCQLLDVSGRGFSVVASQKHSVGEVVEATLRFEGRALPVQVCIQSVRELSKGRIRYGLHPVGNPEVGGDIFKMLHHMGMALQRQQLQRLAGVS